MKLSKTLLVLPVVLGVLTAGLAWPHLSSATDVNNEIVGAWEVTADAPYAPHLFTFSADGTMFTTNPTNVQENSSSSHGGTNDSLGMGAWKVQVNGGTKYVVGTFEQLNAFADNHQPTDTLAVSFKVTLDPGSDTFDGPAVVHLGSFTVPSHITGTKRIVVDQAALDTL